MNKPPIQTWRAPRTFTLGSVGGGRRRFIDIAVAGWALALLAGCGGTSQKARWVSQETGCRAEEIGISDVRRGTESVSYYATCGDGSLYECVSSGRFVNGISTSYDMLEGAEEDERQPTLLSQTDIEALLEREMTLPPSREVAAADGRWTTSAPAVTMPVLQNLANDVTQVQFGLSSEVQSECFFYQRSDARGLASGTYVLLENGRLHSQMELQRVGGRTYKATGTVQDKPFKATLVAQQQLASSVAIYARMRETAGRGGMKEWLQYMPDIDPEGLLKVRYLPCQSDGSCPFSSSTALRTPLTQQPLQKPTTRPT